MSKKTFKRRACWLCTIARKESHALKREAYARTHGPYSQ